MQTWLVVFLGRLTGGERLEKAARYDYRLWLGILVLTPVLMTLFSRFGGFVSEPSTLFLWLGATAFVLVTLVVVLAWALFVPALVSLGLALISWSVMFFWFSPFK